MQQFKLKEIDAKQEDLVQKWADQVLDGIMWSEASKEDNDDAEINHGK